jgi:alkanesulfonate monooxygenase SsuD/methylene tetrahydromethanopterin reductase-like flavin-dependent oxidoreductase (luciferase family)
LWFGPILRPSGGDHTFLASTTKALRHAEGTVSGYLVQLSMTLPTMLPHTRYDLLAWCRGIDDGPWTSLAVPERITYTSHDTVVQLAAAAAVTERVRLWTTIVILPAHDAVAVAKQMASVDVLSGGRLTMGVGIGGREHDYRAVNASFARRFPRLDEQVATMRRIWNGEPPFDGADPVGPPPIQPGGPPLIAGVFGPKGIARAARWASGVDGAWTLDGSRDAMAAAFAQIRDAWRDAGREEAPHLSSSIWYALGDDAEQQLRSYAFGYLKIFGDAIAEGAASMATCAGPEALRRAVDNARAAGADEYFLVPTTADPAELVRTADALGDFDSWA